MDKAQSDEFAKQCSKCGLVLPLCEFNLSLAKRGRPGARKKVCKKCQSEAQRIWRENNPARIGALRDVHYEKALERNRNHYRRATDELPDWYVVRKLLKLQDAPPALIAAARTHQLIKRYLKESK